MSDDVMSREFHAAQIAKVYVEIEKMRTENDKIRAETTKLGKESKYFVVSMLLSSAVLGAVIALTSAMLTKLYL